MTGPLTLDARARVLHGGATIVGGDPPRVLRLTPAGARAARALLEGAAADGAARAVLAQQLIRAGLAHPRPVAAPADAITLVIPVRDRPDALDRCLSRAGAIPTIVVDDGSADPDAVSEVCTRYGTQLVRHPAPAGPAAARNAALSRVRTELVAFLDSDCEPTPGWLEVLCGAFADPGVGAVAPRIRPLRGLRPGPATRFAVSRSPLDLGPDPARVRPGGRVAYVPSTALVVRRAALAAGFDPRLRYGEDVDLVWRMHDAGWVIRYEPAAVVGHREPVRWRALTCRRFRYGSAAGQLARRHPGRLAPVRLHPRPTAVIALAACGAPRLASGAAALHLLVTVRSLRHAGVPARIGVALAATGLADSGVALGRALTMLAPGLLAAGLVAARTRPAAVSLLLAEPVRSWWRARPSVDLLRWSALAIADDIAYGTGVWAGSLRAGVTAPLRPSVPVTGFPAGAFRRGAD